VGQEDGESSIGGSWVRETSALGAKELRQNHRVISQNR
jgi:hypothetical protein